MVTTSRYHRLSAGNVISVFTMIIVAIIVLAIAFVLLKANQQNMIVNWFVDAGRWLTTPFHNIFNPKNPREEVLLNWGLAAIVYGLIGGFLARLVRS